MRKKLRREQFLSGLLCLCLIPLMLSGCKKGDTSSAPTTLERATGPIPDRLQAGAPPIEEEIDGFTWITSKPQQLGDPKAINGGMVKTSILDWPDTLRIVGRNKNTYLNSITEQLCYESLLRMHPVTREFMPGLATHWYVSEDKLTFRFRINPEARWSDGKPVNADDVIATYRLSQDTSIEDPMWKQIMGEFNEPIKISNLEVEVKCKEKNWRHFITFSGQPILQADQIANLEGKEFLEKFNYKLALGTGPYIVHDEDIKTDESITLTRREDYWAKDATANLGLNNFDRIRFMVTGNQQLALMKTIKGDLDFLVVSVAKRWYEDLTPAKLAAVKRGHLVRQKVFTKSPVGTQGFAINMRKPPLDDVRVRRALSHLWNRREMLHDFAYDEYVPSKSYFSKSDGENPANAMIEFDPERARRLLAEAGWKNRDSSGYLLKDGQRLSLKLLYRTANFEKYLNVLVEDCKRAGIEIKPNIVTQETHWRNIMDRKFELASAAWTGSQFPYPRSNWSSEMADDDNTNNITGVKSEQVDTIIEKYDAEFDLQKRNELLRQLDGELYELTPYVLDWYAPAERLLYWNRFGTPEYVLPRYGDDRDIYSTWWINPEKDEALRQAKTNPAMSLPRLPYEVDYWTSDTASASPADE